jgi:hypothetical protein
VETCLALSFLLTIVFALLFLALLASTKHIVNYAAFAGARASMYGASDSRSAGQDRLAVREVTRMMNWGRPATSDATPQGYRVSYPTPLAFPLFNHAAGNIVIVTAVSPVPQQPSIPEQGDNAR